MVDRQSFIGPNDKHDVLAKNHALQVPGLALSVNSSPAWNPSLKLVQVTPKKINMEPENEAARKAPQTSVFLSWNLFRKLGVDTGAERSCCFFLTEVRTCTAAFARTRSSADTDAVLLDVPCKCIGMEIGERFWGKSVTSSEDSSRRSEFGQFGGEGDRKNPFFVFNIADSLTRSPPVIPVLCLCWRILGPS